VRFELRHQLVRYNKWFLPNFSPSKIVAVNLKLTEINLEVIILKKHCK
jgi:hypothetical protein